MAGVVKEKRKKKCIKIKFKFIKSSTRITSWCAVRTAGDDGGGDDGEGDGGGVCKAAYTSHSMRTFTILWECKLKCKSSQ